MAKVQKVNITVYYNSAILIFLYLQTYFLGVQLHQAKTVGFSLGNSDWHSWTKKSKTCKRIFLFDRFPNANLPPYDQQHF
jgi:hypothetical protein